MGKTYSKELELLETTYRWAILQDISGLVDIISRASSFPLLAVGSGGSLSVAEFLTNLHTYYTGQMARVSTPLELEVVLPRNGKASIWILSAGGGNPDVLNAYTKTVLIEPSQLVVMCGKPNSALVGAANNNHFVDQFSFIDPSGGDGFLATNSLIAFSVLLARAYCEIYSESVMLPPNLEILLDATVSSGLPLKSLLDQCQPIWERDTTVVLYGATQKLIAIDLESKFTEAAIGGLQFADFRNFAHGRHHWLAKRGASSAILAFSTPDDRKLALQTISLIPSSIPVVHIELQLSGIASQIASLVVALHIVYWASQVRGIDPGRPGVPEFGRKLYNLRKMDDKNSEITKNGLAIWRKTGVAISELKQRGHYTDWEVALTKFKQRLSCADFSAIVFDYDGTLVDASARFYPPEKPIQDELNRLLQMGVPLGIATGRGKSVRKDLQEVIPPCFWDRVIIGYYNGAEIGGLGDNSFPNGEAAPIEILKAIEDILRADMEIIQVAKISGRQFQLTLEPKVAIPEGRLWDIVKHRLQISGIDGVELLRSSHSVDIVASNVTKKAILFALRNKFQLGDSAILTIGDRGRWPGNDYLLLSEPYSLSVEECSTDPCTCWNLAGAGTRGSQATAKYCHSLILASDREGPFVKFRKI